MLFWAPIEKSSSNYLIELTIFRSILDINKAFYELLAYYAKNAENVQF